MYTRIIFLEKKEAGLTFLKKHQQLLDSTRKKENLLVGEIIQLVEKNPDHHLDKKDEILRKERERLINQNKAAAQATIGAINLAELRMKQQAERMDKLKEIVSQQTVRAAYLENFSRNQQGDLEFLKKETTRLTEGKQKFYFILYVYL